MKKITLFKIISAVLSLLALAAIAFEFFVLKLNIVLEAIIAVIFIVLIIVILSLNDSFMKEASSHIEDSVEKITKEVFEESKVGILVYDENYEIVWMSKLFHDRNMERIGERVFSWLPELEHLLKSGQVSETVIINDDKYLVTKKENNSLAFKDITNEYDLKKKNEESAYVLGLVSYDNYDETTESEEDITFINTNIKAPVVEYFKNFEIDCKTLRSNRLLLVLNEKQFNCLLEDRFSIMNKVRQESKKGDLFVTLSMGFARGSENLNELDTLAQELLELAKTRGGDQVVSRIVGQEAEFYGGSSEARENKSKVKVRVIANSLRDLIVKASNVIITGHMDADADSIGSALCISAIATKLNKEAFVIYDEDKVEPMIGDVIDRYYDELSERHHLVKEEEALNNIDNDSLVIMVDHHSSTQSLGKEVLKIAKNIVIVDHHRRKADLDVDPSLVYIEAGSSSSCELTTELLPYLIKRNALTAIEANIMYLGIVIDTNHFRSRTDERTFDVAKTLKRYGADPLLCEELSQEPFENLKKKSELVDKAYSYKDNILISSADKIYSRSTASQACDSLVQTKEIDAAFVICSSGKEEAIITARSNGKVNVQTILEKMNGGGHMTAAGLQTKDKSVKELENELKEIIEEYLKKEVE